MDLGQAFKTSTPVKKSIAGKSKIVSKFGFICKPKSGVDIEGLKPKLFKFSEPINLSSDVAVIALALVIGKNETTSVLHIAERKPWLLRRAIKLLPKGFWWIVLIYGKYWGVPREKQAIQDDFH